MGHDMEEAVGLKSADFLTLLNYFVYSNVLLISRKLNRIFIFIFVPLNKIDEFGTGEYVKMHICCEDTFSGVDQLIQEFYRTN